MQVFWTAMSGFSRDAFLARVFRMSGPHWTGISARVPSSKSGRRRSLSIGWTFPPRGPYVRPRSPFFPESVTAAMARLHLLVSAGLLTAGQMVVLGETLDRFWAALPRHRRCSTTVISAR